MDEFEDDLTRHFESQVAGWSPEPGPLVPRKGSPLVLASVATVAAVALGAGITWAVTSGGGGHRARDFASIVPAAASSDSPSEAPAAESVASSPSEAPSPSVAVSPSEAVSPSAVLSPRIAGTIAPSASTSTPSAGASVSAHVPDCTAADVQLTLSADKGSYVQGTPVSLSHTVAIKRACGADPRGITRVLSASGQELWNSSCGLPTGACANDGGEYHGLTSGASYASTATWDQVSGRTADDHALYVAAQDYTVTFTLGAASTRTTVHVTAAPTCGSLVEMTSSASTVAPGQSVTFTGHSTNTSGAPCASTPTSAPERAIIAGGDGTGVWSLCAPVSVDPNGGRCVDAFSQHPTYVAAPGEAIAVGVLDNNTPAYTYSWTWDGTIDTASGPKPAPAGTYSVSWYPYGLGSFGYGYVTVTG